MTTTMMIVVSMDMMTIRMIAIKIMTTLPNPEFPAGLEETGWDGVGPGY